MINALFLLLLLFTPPLSSSHANEQTAQKPCNSITLSKMSWNSANFIAHTDKFIIDKVFKCKTNLISGDTAVTIRSLKETNQPDIIPELWGISEQDFIREKIKKGDFFKSSNTFSDKNEHGFYVPEYLIKKYPELKTISGVKKHAQIFKSSKLNGTIPFYGCPQSWTCGNITLNLFKAFKLKDHGFTFINAASGLSLAEKIEDAFRHQKPWIGYYWSPSAIMHRYKLVKIDLQSPSNPTYFKNCLTLENCQNPQPTKFYLEFPFTLVSKKIKNNHPKIFNYLEKRSFSNKEINIVLNWIDQNKGDGEDAMEYFMKNHRDIWSQWLTIDQIKILDQEIKNL